MRAVIVDDESLAIDELLYFLSKYEVEVIATYTDSKKAYDNVLMDKPEVVFIDIDMPEISGIDLALQIQSIFYDVIIIFVTAYSQYAVEAFKAHPIDYILKPIRASLFDVTMHYVMRQNELIKLKQLENHKRDKLCISCFGKLEIMKNKEEIMKFTTKKSKELFSYFICRFDKPTFRDEILHSVYADYTVSKSLNHFYVTLYRLRNALSNFGFDEDTLHINKNYDVYIRDGVCDFVDFYRFIKNNTMINENNIDRAELFAAEYFGEVFSDLDTEWTNEAREWTEVHMEELMLMMADYYRTIHSIKLENIIKKLIDINPLAVRGYEALLEHYIVMKENERYKNIFKKYSITMKSELNLELSERYLKYYKSISN